MERIIDFLFGFGIAILAAFFNHLLTKDQIQKQFKNDIELMKQTVTEELMKIKDIHINEKILSTLNLLTLGYYKNDYNNSVETFFHTNEGSIQLEQISATLSVYGSNEIRAILRKLSSEMKNHITFNNYTSEITRLNNDLAIERGKGELSNDDIVGELIYDLDFYEDQLKQMNMNYDMVEHYRNVRVLLAILISELNVSLFNKIIEPKELILSQNDFRNANDSYITYLNRTIEEIGLKDEFKIQ